MNREKKFRTKVNRPAFLLVALTIVFMLSFSGCIMGEEEEKRPDHYYKGLDLSFWQGDIDWDTLVENDVDFVILRVAYGTEQDERFSEYVNEAYARGLKIGGYVYSLAETEEDAVNEAKACLSMIESIGAKDYFTYPICFDFETEFFKNPERKKENAAVAKAFVSVIEEAGYQSAIYTSLAYFHDYYDLDEIKKVDKWVARYMDDSSLDFNEWNWDEKHQMEFDLSRVTMWQFTNVGTISGINEFVDTDICFGYYQKEELPVEK